MANVPKKISLVLSGGSEKGYFQAGAFRAIIEAGYAPDRIYGTSVGSLNGAFISHAAAMRARQVGHDLSMDDWHTIAMQLLDYWLANIITPKDIAIQRSSFSDVWDIIFKHFKGIVDTTPIISKINDLLTHDLPAMAAGPVQLTIASVDFVSGKLFYTTPKDPDFLTYIVGSMSIPVIMPPAILPAKADTIRQVLFDGGVRAVAPFSRAINEGATNIIAVLCQADNSSSDTGFNEGKILDIAERALDIVVNQNVNNDVKFIDVLNGVISEAKAKQIELDSLKNYKLISHTVIRPETPLTTDISSFTSDDIKAGIEIGYETAKKKLGI